MKKIIFLIIDIIIVYLIFVGIDAYRIKSKPFRDIRPLITIDEKETKEEKVYQGLGYIVVYYTNSEGEIHGASFTLLAEFLIWAYIE